MTTNPAPRRGRKPVASRLLLQEAAGELFIEQGYQNTTIEDVTMRAGVSRSTFFNYFKTKADLLWAPLDEAIAEVAEYLEQVQAAVSPLKGLSDALFEAARGYSALELPLVATQYETMGINDELVVSGMPRFARLAATVGGYLVGRGYPPAKARVVAYVTVAATLAAAATWAEAGVTRGALVDAVVEAITPLLHAFGQP